MEKVRFGTYVQAFGDNSVAAHISGISPLKLMIGIYAICGITAGMAGTVEVMRLGVCDPSKIGLDIELDAIAATVIGGTPISGGKVKVVGTMLGVLIMRIITIMVNMNNIQFEYSLILKAGVVVLAIFLQKVSNQLKNRG